jgi:UPF0716 protein FxsA
MKRDLSMRPVKMVVLGVLLLPLAEVAAFVLVASITGLGAAFMLLILASLAGIFVLRSVGGRGAVTRLRAAAGRVEISEVNLDGRGIATGLGGILLLIPGFITGLLGLAVIFPQTRQWLLTGFRHLLFASARQPTGPPVIDLEPEEWRHLPSPKLPPRKRRSKR